jgi:hypothetical protein
MAAVGVVVNALISTRAPSALFKLATAPEAKKTLVSYTWGSIRIAR